MDEVGGIIEGNYYNLSAILKHSSSAKKRKEKRKSGVTEEGYCNNEADD